ncbi:MAG: hypothetical protein ACKOFA_05760 [Rhodoluna sp.]
MKRILSAGLVLAFGLANALPAASDPAVTNPIELTLEKAQNAAVASSKIFKTETGSVLVSWVEERDSKNWLKTKILRNNNELSRTVTVTHYPPGSEAVSSLPPVIVANKSNNYFAVWVVASKKADIRYQRIVGSKSIGGLKWSKPFVVIPNTALTRDRDSCRHEQELGGCGFARINAAIDEVGNLAVLVAENPREYTTTIWATATSRSDSWPERTKLGKVSELRNMDVVGLDYGFAANYMNYLGGRNCAVFVNFFGRDDRLWSKPMRATFIPHNTVINSQWVQRDVNTLTLVLAAEIDFGGLYYRNFDLRTMAWVSLSKTIQPPKSEYVYQNITAKASGENLSIGYVSYDRTARLSRANLAIQNGVDGKFSTGVVASDRDQINPIFLDVASDGEPVFGYQGQGIGSRMTKGLKGKSLELPVFGNSNYLESASIDQNNNLFTSASNENNGIIRVGLLKGKLD